MIAAAHSESRQKMKKGRKHDLVEDIEHDQEDKIEQDLDIADKKKALQNPAPDHIHDAA